MTIAVVTGASSGQGREFAKEISKRYSEIEELWLISRKEDKMEIAENIISKRCRILPMDLTDKESLDEYKKLLEKENPHVAFLVNGAGFGKFGSTKSIPLSEINDMIELNVKATVNMSLLSLPYMTSGSKIINMSSVSAFTPLPFFNVYAATKAFILRFSKALGNELKNENITVTAVCPYWVDTNFIEVAKDVPEPETVSNFRFIRQPKKIVEKALDDCENGKSISLYGFVEHSCRVLSKAFCEKIQMAVWNYLRDR